MKKIFLSIVLSIIFLATVFAQKKEQPTPTFKIDLDSIGVTGELIRNIIKQDSSVFILDYTINLNPSSNIDSIEEKKYWINLSVKKIKKSYLKTFKDAEIEKANKKVDDIDKQKAKVITERDNIKKQ